MILLKGCLSNVPFYMMSMFELPKGPCKKIEFFMKRLLWREGADAKKYHLVRWEKVCQPTEMGGLGVVDLKVMNICLLSKWLWKLENGEGIWQNLVRRKYVKITVSACVKKPGQSHFWQGLMGVKDIFFKFRRKVIGNGERTRFWEDLWVGDRPLCERFSRLYNLTFSKNVLVAAVLNTNWVAIKFRRVLWGETALMWQNLKDLCAHIRLVEEEDRCKWLLTKSGSFSVKSMYLALKLGSVKWKHEGVWLTRVPMKIKVFLWLVFHKSILTKDVLIRRGWKGKDSKCCFCDELETIDHLFFGCVMANYVWNVVKCATGVMDIPRHFQDMSEWIMRFL